MFLIRRCEFVGVLVLWIISSGTSRPAIAQPVVKQVVIRSEWAGLGIPPDRQSILEISRKPSGVYERSDGTAVEVSRVAALLAALNAAPKPKADLRDLGIDRGWLVGHFALAEKRNDELESHADASARQRALFRETFESPTKLEPIVEGIFSALRHTDDNPWIRIKVIFDDGSVEQAESNSQYEFMLPWKINVETGGSVGFNRDISRAVVALMPDGTTNRERLNGDAFPEVLGSAVMEAIQDNWDLLGVEEKCPKVLAELRSRYKLQTATISGNYAIEYGREWIHDHPKETNIQAVVSSPKFPSGFDETVVLEKIRDRVVGVDEFLNQAGIFESLSFTVPWLADYQKVHPGVSIHLYYVHTASLADRGLQVFRADMKAIGKRQLGASVEAIHDRVALLVIDEKNGQTFTKSHWIVLPDHRMILWRYSGRESALAPFQAHECSREDPEAVGGCVGRVKLANGEWQKLD
jgi:hypothetical protein